MNPTSSLKALPGWLAGRGRWLVLGVVCLGLWLPGFCTMPVFDRDEARFAQASRQMLEGGDWVDIRFQDEARHKKPAGIYWLQAAAVRGVSSAEAPVIGPYRLPSLLGALVAVFATAWAGARVIGPAPAALAGLMLAGSVLLGVEARMAKTDAALLATVVIAQGVLARAWLDRAAAGVLSWPVVLAFWGALGVGIMIKGPIGAMVTVLTVLTLCVGYREVRWLRRLRPLAGFGVVLALAAPWLIAIGLRTGGAFFREAVGHDLAAKVTSGQEGKGLPPGFYLGTFWLTFAPFAGVVALGTRRAWQAGWRQRDEAVLFCLAWILPSWLVFEIVPTKLLHYTLPTFPALALLAAAAVMPPSEERRDVFRWLVLGLGSALVLALGVGIVVLPMILDPAARTLDQALPALPAVAGALLAARAGLDWGRRPPLTVALTTLAGMAALSVTAYHVVLPHTDALWLSRSAAALVSEHRSCPTTGGGNARVVSGGYTEPSLVFLLGTPTRLGDGPTAATLLRQDPACTLALVEAKEQAPFTTALAGLPVRILGQVSGFNYSRGQHQSLTLYTASPPPAPLP